MTLGIGGRTALALALVLGGTTAAAIGPADGAADGTAQIRLPGLAPATASLFEPGVVNTDGDEYGPALSPDHQTLYFVRRVERDAREQIMVSRFGDDGWSMPEVAPFSGNGFDKEPFAHPNGEWLYFASTRRHDDSAGEDDFDLWTVRVERNGWGRPRALEEPVNSAHYENYPSITLAGVLYFSSQRPGGMGGNDLYRAVLDGRRVVELEHLPAPINSAASDADPWISPREQFLIFSSTRDGGAGQGDLYVARREDSGWGAPQRLGDSVNSGAYEYTPLYSAPFNALLFSRDWGEIYWIDAAQIPLLQDLARGTG